MKLSVRRLWVTIALILTALGCLILGFARVAAAPVPTEEGATMISLQIEEIDPRYKTLEAFFRKYKCPEPLYVNEYIQTADKYGIDYRLLPSISVQESTCNKQSPGLFINGKYINGACNNAWGWLIYGENRRCFESIPAGIDEVLKNFGTNPKWMGTPKQILYRYNGAVNPQYPASVMAIMNKIE